MYLIRCGEKFQVKREHNRTIFSHFLKMKIVLFMDYRLPSYSETRPEIE